MMVGGLPQSLFKTFVALVTETMVSLHKINWMIKKKREKGMG
jgi:hypothetical protein